METTASGGGGESLPVDDTTSIVQDPVDTTKQTRIDTGAVATSTTRVINMPDSDVDLKKSNVSVGSPANTADESLGYSVGSRWWDTTADVEYVCLDATDDAAIWVQTTSGGGGESLPVDDTTSIVRDELDNTKQIRMEASTIASGNTRVLQMPDSNVTLHKDNIVAGMPTAGDDSDDGYSQGSRWLDTDTNKEYVCLDATVGAAVWVETTGGGGGGEGDTHPVDDTTPLVQDPVDNTKRTRIDTGAVASGQTRALIMPDASVSLFKDNMIATAAPTANDDVDLGYNVGSRWFDLQADKEYVCLDNSNGGAVWVVSASFPGALPSDVPNVPASRTWEFSRSGGVVGTNDRIVKQPGESITVAADFTDLLGPAETISVISSVTAASSLNVTTSNNTIVGQYVTFGVSGGINLRADAVTITIVTSEGDTIIGQGRLHIVD